MLVYLLVQWYLEFRIEVFFLKSFNKSNSESFFLLISKLCNSQYEEAKRELKLKFSDVKNGDDKVMWEKGGKEQKYDVEF